MSIESEITRLVEAKQVLENWLIKQNVAVPNDALLGDLVKLLNAVQTSSGSAEVASVTLSKGTGVSVSSCYIFSGGSLASKSSTATTLPCAVGDLIILAVTVNGGTTRTYASSEISITGDLTYKTAYTLTSNSASVRGVGVYLIQVYGSGSVSLTRKTGTGTIM